MTYVINPEQQVENTSDIDHLYNFFVWTLSDWSGCVLPEQRQPAATGGKRGAPVQPVHRPAAFGKEGARRDWHDLPVTVLPRPLPQERRELLQRAHQLHKETLLWGCVCVHMHMRVFAGVCVCACGSVHVFVCVLRGYVMFISTVVMEPNSTVEECMHGH